MAKEIEVIIDPGVIVGVKLIGWRQANGGLLLDGSERRYWPKRIKIGDDEFELEEIDNDSESIDSLSELSQELGIYRVL